MFVPFLTRREPAPGSRLTRRRGGGGHSSGGGGSSGGTSGSTDPSTGGSSTGSGTGSSGSGTTGSGSSTSGTTETINGTPRTVSSSSFGGGAVTTIPAGQPFAGRQQGGGTRGQVYGTSTYGSGYPGVSGHGVDNRPFPFYFWPVIWGQPNGKNSYLHNQEYGKPNNAARPGGALKEVALKLVEEGLGGGGGGGGGSDNSTLTLISDSTTTNSLINSIKTRCSSSLGSTTLIASDFDPDAGSTAPAPEQVIQYYRASSVALALSGYSNSAALSDDPNSLPPTPIPTTANGRLSLFITCVNLTIGSTVPLVDTVSGLANGGVGRLPAGGSVEMVGLLWVVWMFGLLF